MYVIPIIFIAELFSTLSKIQAYLTRNLLLDGPSYHAQVRLHSNKDWKKLRWLCQLVQWRSTSWSVALMSWLATGKHCTMKSKQCGKPVGTHIWKPSLPPVNLPLWVMSTRPVLSPWWQGVILSRLRLGKSRWMQRSPLHLLWCDLWGIITRYVNASHTIQTIH